MANKIFKNLDEQIEILKSKGLTIEDEVKAKEILLSENYFFLSGYRHFFMNDTKPKYFIPGTTFKELYGVFNFDRHLRNIFFKNILIIENNIKSIMSYQLSKQYGFKDKDYLNPKNFTQDPMKVRQVNDVLDKMKRQIRINGRKHSATLHYISNYGYIPMWILVKVLSLGIISELYAILKNEDKKAIADFYKIDSETLSIYLANLANFRNLCAHEDIMYDYHTNRPIPSNKYHYKLDIPQNDDEYIYGKNDVFSLLIIMKVMLKEDEFKLFMDEIDYEINLLDGIINVIPLNSILNKISFPDNWRDIMYIH